MTDCILGSDIDSILMLECEISDYLQATNNCYVHFEYREIETETEIRYGLKILTFNRVHRRAFLLKEFEGDDKVAILEKALGYVKFFIKIESNYTVRWTDLNSGKSHVSYFRGYNVNEIKSKLYCHTGHFEGIQIDEIILSPMA